MTCTRGVHLDLKGATEGAHPPKEGMLHHHNKAEGAIVPDNGTKVQFELLLTSR